MAQNPEFKYAPMFQLGEDKTEYYLLTKDYVSEGEFEGHKIVKVQPEALTMLSKQCFHDANFLLRRAHTRCRGRKPHTAATRGSRRGAGAWRTRRVDRDDFFYGGKIGTIDPFQADQTVAVALAEGHRNAVSP